LETPAMPLMNVNVVKYLREETVTSSETQKTLNETVIVVPPIYESEYEPISLSVGEN
jgi:hypothetical protein